MQSNGLLPLLSVRHVTKRFPLNRTRERYILDLLRRLARLPKRSPSREEFSWPVNDVSFELNAGETLGIIGQNGTGKSTLLKIIGRILQPTSGSVDARGRVATLLELGAGFHPDLTGRENIYLNSSILGLSRLEVNRCLDKIIEFADIGPFIDSPVKHYSSGMRVRLGFSIAVHVQPDLLLVDEILAVGDENFQHKCLQAFYDFRRAGGTLVLVSHSLEQVREMCQRVIWLDDGCIQADGSAEDVIARYLNRVHNLEQQQIQRVAAQRRSETVPPKPGREASTGAPAVSEPAGRSGEGLRWGDQAVEILGVQLLNGDGVGEVLFRTGEPLTVKVEYAVRRALEEPPIVGLAFVRHDDTWCYGTNSEIDRIDTSDLCLPEFQRGYVRFIVDSLPLLPGTYTVDVALHSRHGGDHDYWRRCAELTVRSVIRDTGIARVDHRWSIEPGAVADLHPAAARAAD